MGKKRTADIVPQNGLDLRHLIEQDGDPAHRALLEELAALCRAHGAQWQWYAPWLVYDHATGERMGLLYFGGAPEDGIARLTLELAAPWRGSVSAGGALEAALEWAFKYGEVYVVRVRAEDEELGRLPALLRAPKRDGWFEVQKPRTPWIPVWLALGLLLGAVGGRAALRPALGAALGAVLGAAVGLAFTLREHRRRAAVARIRS